jgi:molecular chaperone HtpG
MYSDPNVVFREYIQNSVDSIDKAVDSNIIQKGEEQIVVQLLPTESRIIIKDNGMGIPSEEAEKVLISIGNSKKTTDNSRGFRGIGRLSVLSYCQKLTFSTSYPGEKILTRVIIDAEKLTGLLSDTNKKDVTVLDVLHSVYTVETCSEKEEAHYFTVQVDGVDENSKLNSYEDVLDYLSQNVPVPFSPEFKWGQEICNRLKNEGWDIKSYNVMVKYGMNLTSVYKPYKDEVLVDKRKKLSCKIQDIEIVKIVHASGEVSSIGWLAKTSYLGSIYDRTVKGIRLRKGNILIGDQQTLNVVFKDARFNGWSMGEIFAIDKELIPNARRDDFEKNPAYFVLYEHLATLSAKITKEIRTSSLNRNAELANAIEEKDNATMLAEDALDSGVNGSKKGAITHKLKSAQRAVIDSKLNSQLDEKYQEIAFDELDMLIGKLKGATSYKALNTIGRLTNTEKKILERVFNVIGDLNIKNNNTVIDAILCEFSDIT